MYCLLFFFFGEREIVLSWGEVEKLLSLEMAWEVPVYYVVLGEKRFF
jgi:hypothetical protein